MNATRLKIEQRHRQDIPHLASLQDFTCVRDREIDPVAVARNPNLSLYCLDEASRRAVFVELPDQVDLTKAAFVYLTQFEQAQNLVTMPFETFITVADSLPAIKQPIFVYITGRSGSTLLSHVFNASGSVASLAEPDVMTQFVHLRRHSPVEADPALTALARSAMRFLFRSNQAMDRQAQAVKLRSEGLQVMDFFQECFPQAKNLFLYRDAIGFATSFHRIFRLADMPEVSEASIWEDYFETVFGVSFSSSRGYLDQGQKQISIPEFLTLWWVASVEWYLAQHARGVPALAVRFADIVNKGPAVIEEVFDYCALESEGIKRGLQAFSYDAQAGTLLGRENPLEGNKRVLRQEQIASIHAILKRHPTINDPDYIVPATLKL
ncbi:MAG: hypothetical protein KDE09_23515 [Anaerolineales bacterium]|nr:hypothetical protein [Anaerolineales bacterium]